MQDILPRINELARKERDDVLTVQEKEEQAILRKTYLIMFRGNLNEILMHTTVIDMDGQDVTPICLKLKQTQYRLRKTR